MTNKVEILKFLEKKKDVFFSEFNIVKIGLFGSYAINKENKESDIDLIIEFLPNTKNLFEKKSKLKAILKSQFNKDIDLCREKYIKPYFKLQILQSVIYV